MLSIWTEECLHAAIRAVSRARLSVPPIGAKDGKRTLSVRRCRCLIFTSTAPAKNFRKINARVWRRRKTSCVPSTASRTAVRSDRLFAADKFIFSPRFRSSFGTRCIASVDEMRDRGRCLTDMKSARHLFYFSIGNGHSFVLAQVLGPGFDDKGFDKSSRFGLIVVKTPSVSAIAQA